jgi:hypothetical protein
MSTRRELLRLGTMAGVAALIPGAAAAGLTQTGFRTVSQRGTRKIPANLPLPTREQLANQVDTTFLVQPAGQRAISLTLVDVTDAAFAATPGSDECFRALFRGPSNISLRQDSYPMANKGLGKLTLFLVPVGRHVRGARYYEASFNRVVPS